MFSKLFAKKPQTIPKSLHFIWVGNILDANGQENVVNWAQANKDYSINLWFDSALFPPKPVKTSHVSEQEFQEQLAKYNEFDERRQNLIRWSQENNVTLRDVSAMSESIRNKKDYYDETSGKHANLAAASDILRVQILENEGGVYLDVKDVLPSIRPLGALQAPKGFLCHIDPIDGRINNDILASVPHGDFIRKMNVRIGERYSALANSDREQVAHRTPIFGGPDLFQGLDSRRMSTVAISGPTMLGELLAEQENPPSTEELLQKHGLDYMEEYQKYFSAYVFDQQLYQLPKQQAKSWGVNLLETDLTAFSSYVKHCLSLLFVDLIKKSMNNKVDAHTNGILTRLTILSAPQLADVTGIFSSVIERTPSLKVAAPLVQNFRELEANIDSYLQRINQLQGQERNAAVRDFVFNIKDKGLDHVVDVKHSLKI